MRVSGEQPPASRAGVGGQAGEPADLLGDLGHLLAGLEEPLGVAAVEVAPVERHQPAGGVEDVDGRRVEPVGVADGVGEDGAEPGLRATPAIRAAWTEVPGPRRRRGRGAGG